MHAAGTSPAAFAFRDKIRHIFFNQLQKIFLPYEILAASASYYR